MSRKFTKLTSKRKHPKPKGFPLTYNSCGQWSKKVTLPNGKKKTFYGCTRYPACDFIEWDPPRPIPCPAGCGSAYLVEKTSKRKGLVLRCPKCRAEHPPEAVGA